MATGSTRVNGRDPSILMLSPRTLFREPYRCAQTECEDVIAAVEDVHLVAPQPRTRGQSELVRRANRIVTRLLHAEMLFHPAYERVKLEHDYDLFVMYVRDVDDLKLLDLVPGWRERCRRAVCICEEVWMDDFEHPRCFERLKDFDLITTQFAATVEPLRAYARQPVLYLPAAVDTLRFFPGVPGPRRTIDVFGMGRRVESMHARLKEYAHEDGLTYLFDTLDPARVRDGLREHREQFAELIKRSRYFIVNRAKVDLAHQGGRYDEVGHRSFEGAAGGAVLIGHTPRSASASALFDWPDAHLFVDLDSSAIIDLLRDLESDPDRVQRIRQDNVSNMLRRHDWSHRWLTLLQALDVPASSRLTRRIDLLSQLATDYVEQRRGARLRPLSSNAR